MIRAGAVEIPPGGLAAEFRFLIAAAENPKSLRGLAGFVFEGGNQLLDVAHAGRAAIDVRPTRVLWVDRLRMQMRIDESWHDGFVFEVEHLRVRADPLLHLVVGAGRNELSVCYGKGIRAWRIGVDGDDVGMLHHQVGGLSGTDRNGRSGEDQKLKYRHQQWLEASRKRMEQARFRAIILHSGKADVQTY